MLTPELEAKLAAAGDPVGYVYNRAPHGGFAVAWYDKSRPASDRVMYRKSRNAYLHLGSSAAGSWQEAADLIERYTGRRPTRRGQEAPSAAANVQRKARSVRERYATQEDFDAEADRRARRRQRSQAKKKRKGGSLGKTKRSPFIRAYAINRAEHRTLNGHTVYICESTGEPFAYGLHVHHVRTEDECDALGILWDSRQNVLAITPNEHARVHYSREHLVSLYPVIDAMYPRPAVG